MNQQPEFSEGLKTQEHIKQETFNDVVRRVLYRFSMEGQRATHFESMGKKFPITNVAGAILALSQDRRVAAQSVYNQTNSH